MKTEIMKKKNKGRRGGAEIEVSGKIHCLDITIRQHEFNMFLEQCTSSLHLPSACRRLFDSTGKELTSLESLNKNDLVYVTMGEGFVNPEAASDISQASYVARLAADVRAIEQLQTLTSFRGLCMEVEGSDLKAGSLVKVGICELSGQEREAIGRTPTPSPVPTPPETEEEMLAKQNCRFRSHYYADKYMEKHHEFQWMSHCKMCKGSNTCQIHDYEVPPQTPPAPKPEKPENYSPSYFKQSFLIKDHEFIICKFNPKLAFTVNEFGRLVLATFNALDPMQKWIFHNDGQISPKDMPAESLAICIPACLPGDETRPDKSELYRGCEIMLQPMTSYEFGNAHFKWSIDVKLGIIDAFATNSVDIRLTIANRVGVCSAALNNTEIISQPGGAFRHLNTEYVLCFSCARVFRGMGKVVEKMEEQEKFSCAMHSGLPLTKKFTGSFKALTNEPVDLSPDKEVLTLAQLKTDLANQHKKKVTIPDKPFSFYEKELFISVLARKNGCNVNDMPVLVSANSYEQLISSLSSKLGLGTSCGSLYLFGPEGELMTCWEELLDQVVDSYAARQLGKTVIRPQNIGADGTITYRKSALPSGHDDSFGGGDSPSVDIQLPSRPQTQKNPRQQRRALFAQGEGVDKGLEDERNESSTPVASPVLRPSAPEPKVNLIRNATFDEENFAEHSEVPSHWSAIGGAQLKSKYDSSLDMCYCEVDRPRKASAISQNVSSVIKFNNRYKMTFLLKMDSVKSSLVTCALMFKRSKVARKETVVFIAAIISSDGDDWMEVRGMLNLPKSEEAEDPFESTLFINVTDDRETSFCVTKFELVEDTPELSKLGQKTNLFENKDLTILIGQTSPAYFLPKNYSTQLKVAKKGTCSVVASEVHSLTRASEFEVSYDVTYLVQKKNLFKVELDARSAESTSAELKVVFAYKMSQEKTEKTIVLSETELDDNSWKKVSCRLSLPTTESQPDQIIESCEIRISSQSAFVFKNPVFARETSTEASLSGVDQNVNGVDTGDLEFTDSSALDQTQDVIAEFTAGHSDFLDIRELNVEAVLASHRMPLYVSKTNKFITPEVASEEQLREKEHFIKRRPTAVHLDIEKHKLRLLQGRRVNRCSSARLQPTMDPGQPVVVVDSWSEVTEEELNIQQNVRKLKKSYDSQAIRASTSLTKADYAKLLRPPGKQLFVYKNGEDCSLKENIIPIYASCMDDVIRSATNKLRMGFAARKVYRPDGTLVTNFDDISKHSLLCVSQGESFVNHSDAKRKLFLKARWARDKRLGREQPQTAIVEPRINPLAMVTNFDDISKHSLLCVSQGESFVNHSDAKRKLFLKARWARDKRLGREQPQTAIVEPRINPLAMVNPLGASCYTVQNKRASDAIVESSITFLTQLPVS